MGSAWEEAFRQHLVRMAGEGALRDDIIAIGPWWNTDSSVEIDAVGLVGRTRQAVVAGEAKWARSEDGARLARDLNRKVLALPDADESISFVVCAREELRDVPPDVTAITAHDIFS